jgi:hypothetical protein
MQPLWALGSILIAAALAGCVQIGAPVNSLAFEKRPPLPGQPGYLETISYIDDGMHYISPAAGFFVSNLGDMCFLKAIVPGPQPEYIPPNYWCINPLAVDRVEAIDNNISYINQVKLWCRLAAPQCAYKVGYPNVPDNLWIANSITAETVPFLRQREAVEYLVYLMGGNVQRQQALQ